MNLFKNVQKLDKINKIQLLNLQNSKDSLKIQQNLIILIFTQSECYKVRIQIFPFMWRKQLQFVLKIWKINQQEELDQLKQINKSKDKVLATVSHDLRAPLNIISHIISNAICETKNPEKQQKFKIAQTNADLLMNLIQDILDYSQLKEKKLKINMTQFKLNEILSEIYNIFCFQAQMKNIKFKIKSNFSGGEMLLTDKNRLKQILINLLNNAFKFTQEGFVQLNICKLNIKNEILFTISDSGTGIKPEIVDQLGEPYATFGNSSCSNSTGIGLGLHLCKQLIGFLGPEAKFMVESIFGKGSCFKFIIFENLNNQNTIDDQSLSNINSDAEISENIKEFSQISFIINSQNQMIEQDSNQISEIKVNDYKTLAIYNEICTQAINILIVDDDAFNILILEKLLQKISQNFKIFKAYNGKEAIDLFILNNMQNISKDKNLRLIIMDCQMPVMNGYKSSLQIKQIILNNNLESIPIIGYTSLLTENEIEKSRENKMDFILQKPLTFQDLNNFIVPLLHLNQLLL